MGDEDGRTGQGLPRGRVADMDPSAGGPGLVGPVHGKGEAPVAQALFQKARRESLGRGGQARRGLAVGEKGDRQPFAWRGRIEAVAA